MEVAHIIHKYVLILKVKVLLKKYGQIYKFDLYEHKKFINILKVIVIRHPKHIKKYEEWLKANTENKRVKKLLKKDKVAGEGFEPSTFGYPKSVYSI